MKLEWKRLGGGGAPEARWGHVCVAVANQSFLVFGGNGNRSFNDLHLYSATASSWTKIEAQGTAPTPRYGHSATLFGNQIIIYGGRANSKPFSDVQILQHSGGDRFKWLKNQHHKSPEGRAAHTAVAHGNTLVVFGGHNSSRNKYYNSVLTFNIDTAHWDSPTCEGTIPPARGSHSTFVVGNQMYIFGGFDGKKYYNDLYCLDLDKYTWRKIDVKGVAPKPRSGHSSTLIGDKLVIFGGCGSDSNFLNDLQVLALEDMRWEQPVLAGMEHPHPRFRHTATVMGGNKVLIYAGTGSGTLLGDALSTTINYNYNNYHYNNHYIIDPTSSACTTSDDSTATYHYNIIIYFFIIFIDTTNNTNVTTIDATYHCTDSSCQLAPFIGWTIHTTSNKKEKRSTANKLMRPTASALNTLKLGSEKILSLFEKDNEIKVLRENLANEISNKLLADIRIEKEQAERRRAEDHFHNERMKFESRRGHLEALIKTEQKAKQAVDEKLVKCNTQISQLGDQIHRLTLSVRELENAAAKREKEDLGNGMRKKYERLAGLDIEGLAMDEFDLLEEEHLRALDKLRAKRKERRAEEDRLLRLALEKKTEELSSVLATYVSPSAHAAAIELVEIQRRDFEQKVAPMKLENERLHGRQLDGLGIEELTSLEEVHHRGVKQLSAIKQAEFMKQVATLQREKEHLQDLNTCAVCTDRPPNIVLLPCRHNVLCSTCSPVLSRCPMCRSTIEERIETFT
eukprot:gene13224-15535_t